MKNFKHLELLCIASMACFLSSCSCDRVQCPVEAIPQTQQSEKETMTNNNAQKIQLPSGLAYEVLKGATDANSETPKRGDVIKVHYTGWLSDAQGQPTTKFDSSVDRGTPFEFSVGVGQVIKGWDEGLLMMRRGEKRRLYIPANLGYGARGAGGSIPPHANLIFDVEYL